MERLGRFYTEDVFSKVLVQNISFKNPKIIIDLGIGKGALTTAAFAKWQSATYLGADVDQKQIKETTIDLPFVKIFQASGLQKNISKKLKIVAGTVDVAVCNPPYLRVQGKHCFYQTLLNEVGLNNCNKLRFLTSDLIFLAQNLRLLKDGGELGIILPDGLLTSHEFKHFRSDLIKNHNIKSVIQLPDKIFKGTEARTHILIIEKGMKDKVNTTNLFIADKKGVLKEKITVLSSLLEYRMDFYFHQYLNNGISVKNTKSLSDIGAHIQRGSRTHGELKAQSQKFLHTTSLLKGEVLSFTNHSKKKLPLGNYARKNDILLARVGKGCIGKASLIKKGEILISDCIYRIQVPEYYVEKVWASIISPRGQKWFKSRSHGVCAKVISKEDLLQFPVYL